MAMLTSVTIQPGSQGFSLKHFNWEGSQKVKSPGNEVGNNFITAWIFPIF